MGMMIEIIYCVKSDDKDVHMKFHDCVEKVSLLNLIKKSHEDFDVQSTDF